MWSRRLSSSLPLIASQILTLLSMLAVARSLPSGLNATLTTRSVCPLRVRRSLPVAASQTLAVLSQLADARPAVRLNTTSSDKMAVAAQLVKLAPPSPRPKL